ncbi:MAG: sigma-70 family RNA polymerase sigma factor, partial [Pseudomonas stutzeri]|nr:sigma-70 family RNA polymerase sigma factor [Stutzerimonas stutzeri]NIN81841.1 sigma-70 family RNA polymerase sigma factor [Stutzerimonas stutzeri]NIQ23689.1 sigma-70 family RNA polymerase sigma factor [Stutzerimonas stutzeri]NIQ42437.1 sigma-70 family RNA polymerase sigma factor [Stutzerimonas stutzeri]NIS57861.1 sigma-70 family RNA polymerase sigma factor [Stutzerimonas stutzeri]
DLVQSSHRVVYGLALRVLGSSPEAEDVTQEAYLRVWQARRQYDPRRRFDAWVARIAWNLCKTRLAKEKRQVSLLDQDVES